MYETMLAVGMLGLMYAVVIGLMRNATKRDQAYKEMMERERGGKK